jgi:general secretion pathway protein A
VVPVIDNEMVNQPDAMHQLYLMWGYDASADDALCQNAAKVNLMCKQGMPHRTRWHRRLSVGQ